MQSCTNSVLNIQFAVCTFINNRVSLKSYSSMCYLNYVLFFSPQPVTLNSYQYQWYNYNMVRDELVNNLILYCIRCTYNT